MLQVVQGTLTTQASTTSATFVDSGLSVSITPSSASSKVYIVANFHSFNTRSGSQVGNYGSYNLVRTSTQLQTVDPGSANFASTSTPTASHSISFAHLDSPATTSATTYKVQFKRAETNNTSYIQATATGIASIIAMEIGA